MKLDDMTMREALILLHRNTNRQGPGDDAFTLQVLQRLPALPSRPVIADLGCGTGAGSVLLAQHYKQPVLCVDMSGEFLQSLDARAKSLGIGNLINTYLADMGTLDPKKFQFDLLWSEGAAYNLTFDIAMQKWRPLMAVNGIAAVSEMSWFGSARPKEALDYWSEAYPEMACEQDNLKSAARHGFEVLFTERLPAQAWWSNYYDCLLLQVEVLASEASETLQAAIADTRKEIELYRAFSDHYGYTFYVLRAI